MLASYYLRRTNIVTGSVTTPQRVLINELTGRVSDGLVPYPIFAALHTKLGKNWTEFTPNELGLINDSVVKTSTGSGGTKLDSITSFTPVEKNLQVRAFNRTLSNPATPVRCRRQ